jgi:hypothetical protein
LQTGVQLRSNTRTRASSTGVAVAVELGPESGIRLIQAQTRHRPPVTPGRAARRIPGPLVRRGHAPTLGPTTPNSDQVFDPEDARLQAPSCGGELAGRLSFVAAPRPVRRLADVANENLIWRQVMPWSAGRA